MRIEFAASPEPTLGVEWEFALVDRRTRDLRNDAAHLFARAKARLPDPGRLHKELLRNTVEVVTGVCQTVDEAMTDLRETLAVVVPAGDELGVDLFGAGTHPFASWTAQELTEGHRYEELINRTQWWGRQMLIWGVHVHVGMPDRSRVMPVLTAMLRYYPHLQALSASSPIWAGVDTGYASNRALMFQQLPTAGLPFHFETWEEFEAFADDQFTTGVIEVLSEIRWDLRPAPHLGTLENRVCDGVSVLRRPGGAGRALPVPGRRPGRRGWPRGETLPTMPPWHVQENKWRAARYGLEAIVILDDEVQRAAGHRRPARRAGAAGAGRRAARLRRRAGRRSPRSRRAGRRTSDSGGWPPRPTATWWRWWTRWCRSCGTRCRAGLVVGR